MSTNNVLGNATLEAQKFIERYHRKSLDEIGTQTMPMSVLLDYMAAFAVHYAAAPAVAEGPAATPRQRDWKSEYYDYRDAVEPALGIARLAFNDGLTEKAKSVLDGLCDKLEKLDSAVIAKLQAGAAPSGVSQLTGKGFVRFHDSPTANDCWKCRGCGTLFYGDNPPANHQCAAVSAEPPPAVALIGNREPTAEEIKRGLELEPEAQAALTRNAERTAAEPPEAHEKLANKLAWEYDLDRRGYRALLEGINSVTAGLERQLDEARREITQISELWAAATVDSEARLRRAESAEAANQELRRELRDILAQMRAVTGRGFNWASFENIEDKLAALLGPQHGDTK